MDKTYKAGIICFLCLMLCISGAYLLAASASAEQSVVIISDAAAQQPVIVQSSSAAASFSQTIDNTSASAAETVVIQDASAASSVIVMADNSTVPQAVSGISQNAGAAVEMSPTGLYNDIHMLVNQARNENGLSSLQYSSELQLAADIRARESTVSFTHTRLDGSDAASAIDVDYTIAGENLVQVTTAFATGDIIVSAWMNSPSHRDNILNTSFTRAAIGIYEFNGTTYISQIFAD